jgi:ribosomal protein S18 acetylase RimI-like enzyme
LTDPTVAESCARNWYLEPHDETVVLTKQIDGGGVNSGVSLVDPSDGSFCEALFSINGRRPTDDDTWSRMVSRVSPDAAGLWIRGSAVGFVAVSGPVAFAYSVAVKPKARRNGFGSDVMAAAESWAVEHGARSMAVQVLGTNAPARALYERLGYAEAYRYHYLQAASDESGGT